MAELSKSSICIHCKRYQNDNCDHLAWIKKIKTRTLTIEIIHCPEFFPG